MIQLADIHSLSDFQRNTKEHLQRLKRSGRPEVLTVNGKAEVVVQDDARIRTYSIGPPRPTRWGFSLNA